MESDRALNMWPDLQKGTTWRNLSNTIATLRIQELLNVWACPRYGKYPSGIIDSARGA